MCLSIEARVSIIGLFLPRIMSNHKNFRSFSWQGYASDLGHAANLSDNARVTFGDVQRTQQVMPC